MESQPKILNSESNPGNIHPCQYNYYDQFRIPEFRYYNENRHPCYKYSECFALNFGVIGSRTDCREKTETYFDQ